jgi:hypothetical protein
MSCVVDPLTALFWLRELLWIRCVKPVEDEDRNYRFFIEFIGAYQTGTPLLEQSSRTLLPSPVLLSHLS